MSFLRSLLLGKRVSIIIDGGFRRGTDVIKALSLGANAAMTGRATLYGLAANGERGVERALEILTTEMERAMGQLGVSSVADLGPHHSALLTFAKLTRATVSRAPFSRLPAGCGSDARRSGRSMGSR